MQKQKILNEIRLLVRFNATKQLQKYLEQRILKVEK